MVTRTSTARRLRLFAIVGLAGSITVACTTDSSTGPSPAVTAAEGTYALATINGAAPPVTTVPNVVNCTGITDSGTLTLKTGPQTYDATMNAHFVCLIPPINNVTTTESGTWTVNGSTITFTRTGGVVLNMSSATLNGSTLSVSLDAPSYTQGVAGQRVTTEWRK